MMLFLAFLAGAAVGVALCRLWLNARHAKAAAKRETEHHAALLVAVARAKQAGVQAERTAAATHAAERIAANTETWDEARNLEYARRLKAGEPTTEEEWNASHKWHQDQFHRLVADGKPREDAGVRGIVVQDIDPRDVVHGLLKAQAGIGKTQP